MKPCNHKSIKHETIKLTQPVGDVPFNMAPTSKMRQEIRMIKLNYIQRASPDPATAHCFCFNA